MAETENMHKPAPKKANDAERVQVLESLKVLDTAPEEIFDSITSSAASMLETPIALVSLVDGERQWFKSNVGLPGVTETHRDLAFCSHVVHNEHMLLVEDATSDERFKYSPLVTGAPSIRFYAGAPLTVANSSNQTHTLGSVCVIDSKPRKLTEIDKQLMSSMAFEVTKRLLEHKREEGGDQSWHAVPYAPPPPDAETAEMLQKINEPCSKKKLAPPPTEREEVVVETEEERMKRMRVEEEAAQVSSLGKINRVDYYMFEEIRNSKGFDEGLKWLKSVMESRRGASRRSSVHSRGGAAGSSGAHTPTARSVPVSRAQSTCSSQSIPTDTQADVSLLVPVEKRGLLYTDAAHSVLPHEA